MLGPGFNNYVAKYVVTDDCYVVTEGFVANMDNLSLDFRIRG